MEGEARRVLYGNKVQGEIRRKQTRGLAEKKKQRMGGDSELGKPGVGLVSNFTLVCSGGIGL